MDDETTREARQLGAVMAGVGAAAATNALASLLAGPSVQGRAWYSGPVFLLLVAAQLLRRRGRIQAAGAVLVGGFWLYLVAMRLTVSVVRETTLGWLLLSVLLATLLLGQVAAVVLSAFSMAFALWVRHAEEQGLLPPPVDGMLPAAVAHLTLFVLAVTLLQATTRALTESLQRARHELEERRLAAASLERSERTLRALLDATTETSFLIDRAGVLLVANEPMARAAGHTAAEIVGRNAYEMLPPEIARARRALVEQVLERGEPLRFADRGGDGRWYDNNLYPVFDEAGRVARVAVFARDVTEVRDAQAELARRAEALEKAYGKLERLDRAKSDFITVTAHELRTPLTLVKGYAELLELGAGGAEQVPALAAGIRSGGDRLHQIVEDMLDLSSLEQGPPVLRRQEVAVAEVVDGVVRGFQASLAQRELTLTVALPELPPVPGDSGALRKAVQHLVMNAIKFTPNGGAIAIRGRTVEDGTVGPAVQLSVEDSGIGIDAADHDLIFESFFRADGDALHHSSGRTQFKGGGPGLGLALARRVAEAHGGRLWVESPRRDEAACPGSRFVLVLPLSRA